MKENYYAILMSGGVGSRLWPLSTSDFPKQFQDVLGAGETLIQKTFNRLLKLIPAENILISTNENYYELVLKQLQEISKEQILLEPAMRNTAPCILYASLKIKKQNPNALLVVIPTDHWIEDESQFRENLQTAFDFCIKEKALVNLGIQPTFPNTGYGYIEFDKSNKTLLKRVVQFREKPDYITAKYFLKSDNFLWNTGIFVCNIDFIIDAFKQYQSSMFNLFFKGYKFYNTPEEKAYINEHYSTVENISIDYAIMEKAKDVYVLPVSFDWNDLGTWRALYGKIPKDKNENAIINSLTFLNDASNNIIRTSKRKLVVIDGLSDYIIVDEDEGLLIYPKEKEQHIKHVLKEVGEKYK